MIRTDDRLILATLIVLVGATATIAGAWAFELIGGLKPCAMCLEQRYAYYAVIPLCVIILALRMGAPGVAKMGLALAGLIMLAGGAYAAYHAGVEWKWWEGPTTCVGGDFSSETNLLPDLTKPAPVPCDEAAWRLFGLSLAGYNVLISAFLALVSFWGLRRSAQDRIGQEQFS